MRQPTRTKALAALVVENLAAGGPFPRIANALAAGFSELGLRFDLVSIKGTARTDEDGPIRRIYLGCRGARTAVFRLATYLRSARPEVALVSTPHIAVWKSVV